MSTRSEFRKLTKLIDALTKLKQEIIPEKDDKNADPYDAHKNKINNAMNELRDEIQTLHTISNDRDIIEQKAVLRKKFGDTQTLISGFGDVLKKIAKGKAADIKARDKKVKQGHQWMQKTQEELMSLAENCREVNVSDLNIGRGGGDPRQERREQQKNRRKERREKRRGGGGDDFGEGIYLEDVGQASEKEQEFMIKVEQARLEEEEMLELISQGLTELHELALTLNKLLKKSQHLIAEVDEKMDKVQARFDTANQKLEKMLDDSGGMSRWCPICICLIVLLALAGYIVTKVM